MLDTDVGRRTSLVRDLSQIGYSIPIACIPELERHWPASAILLVHEEGGLLQDALRCLSRMTDWIPILAYAERPCSRQVVRALTAGALSFLDLPLDVRELEEQILSGKCEARTAARQARAKFDAIRRISELTPRELEVFQLLMTGMSSKEIARALGLSPRTVEVFRANILAKLDVRNAVAAARLGFEAGYASQLTTAA
ncbi:response regulator transcription factor [Erythrobacter sp. HI0028]|uniref:response regulator transcription factor n=1 Tax=Erythrobacter sp. HI0028 TaxID=1822227 RepID=UPI0012E8E523|nr:response regulator transcription factor [Erythrobacter sp. HI0028]